MHVSLAVPCTQYDCTIQSVQYSATPQYGMLCISALTHWHTLVAEAEWSEFKMAILSFKFIDIVIILYNCNVTVVQTVIRWALRFIIIII